MKNLSPSLSIFISVLILTLSSCSINRFTVRKNHQPRIRVEAANPIPALETATVDNNVTLEIDSITHRSGVLPEGKITHQHKPKETIVEKMVKIFMPKKKALFEPLLHPKKLNKVKHTTMEGDEITGLVISLLALALAITSIFMIIGMAHGNVWVYFVVGLILAIIALIMAWIAKKVLPFRGISLAAGTLAIVALVLLLIFLVLITVFSIVF